MAGDGFVQLFAIEFNPKDSTASRGSGNAVLAADRGPMTLAPSSG